MSYTALAESLIKAKPAKVWEALTDPQMVAQWLFGTKMSVDKWEVGGKISYKGVWEGKEYEDKGEILELKPGHLLVSSYWSGFSGLPDVPENYQKVTYKLEPMGEDTMVKIIQEGNKTEESAKHSEGNWNMVLGNMKKLLEK